MTDTRRLSTKTFVWVFIVLLVLYPLSYGPAIWLVLHIDPDGRTNLGRKVYSVYYPVVYGADATNTSEWLYSYCLLWTRDPAVQTFIGSLYSND